MTERGGAVVVGASSGIGAALVRELHGRGRRVAALARREPLLRELSEACAGGVLVRVHDVTDTTSVPALARDLWAELGGVDLLVYCAGAYEPVGRAEYDTEKDLAMIAANLHGLVAWGNEAARRFQETGRGTIVGISSVAGDRGRRVAPVYGSTKAAMNAYLESLRNRLWQHGVHVCTIRPGHVATAMTRDMRTLFPVTPEAAARSVLRAVDASANVRYVPWWWRWIGLALRLTPSAVFRRLDF